MNDKQIQMITINKTILFFLFVLTSFLSFGQTTDPKIQKKLEQAKYYLGSGQTDLAIQELNTILTPNPKVTNARWMLGDIYYNKKEYEKAIFHYKLLITNDPKAPSIIYSNIGEALFYQNKYDEAITYFNKYLAIPNISASNQQKIQQTLKSAIFAKDAILKPVPFNPINIGIGVNSEMSEYLPYLTADGNLLFFTRLVGNQEDIFYAQKMDSTWKKAESLSALINTNDNEGAHCISADGKFLFFTACNRSNGLGGCDIMFATNNGKAWSKPDFMPRPINSEAWESQPSFSADGRSLFFTSNRAGGFGGKDIWVSQLGSNYVWGNPVNLGPEINTAGDEQSPFIHPDGTTLYFASDGQPGFGGFDLFFAKKINNNWTASKNLGYPINTAAHEGSLMVSLDGSTAFFASNRKDGMGKLDIYSFLLPEIDRPNKVSYVKAMVTDKKTGSPLDVNYSFVDIETKTVLQNGLTAKDGYFLVTLPAGKEYALNINKKGYLFSSENYNFKENFIDKPVNLDIKLSPIEIGGITVLRNIFFDLDKYELKEKSFLELDKIVVLLNENPTMKIELIGHTDNQGQKQYNQLLSENRAKSVVNYLISKGINKARLSYKGKGDQEPLGSNTTEEGKALNRRTELKIVGY